MQRINRNLKELTSLVLMMNELLEVYTEASTNETLRGLMNEAKIIITEKYNELKRMLEREDVPGLRKMMQHSTERRALFDKK